MSSEKSLAIVLRVIDFSETSCIVTLFTRDFGKISALAKGGRRPKGPFESALDLLAVIRIVFLHKSSDSLDLLTEAKLERRFRAATRDLSRLYAGYYLAELMQQLTDEADPHPVLYDQADAALRALDGPADVPATVLRFELVALREVGHLPSLQACVQCGKRMDESGRIAFGQLAGGVLCQRCRAGHRQVVSLSREAWQTLAAFAEPVVPEEIDAEVGDHRVVDEAPVLDEAPVVDEATSPVRRRNVSEQIPASVRGEVRGVMNHYISNLLGHRPRMHSYLGLLAH